MKRKRKYNGLFNVIVKAKVTDDSRNKLEKGMFSYILRQRFRHNVLYGELGILIPRKNIL